MRMSFPRTPNTLVVGRKTYYVLPSKKMAALEWIARLGLKESLPDGVLTASEAGKLRPHDFSDLVPMGYAALNTELSQPGEPYYEVTTIGRAALRVKVVYGSKEFRRLQRLAAKQDAAKPASNGAAHAKPASPSGSLMARQRARAEARMERKERRERRAA